MKNFIFLCSVALIFALSCSCGNPYRNKKTCKGKGSWYGNRGLSAENEVKLQETQYYVLSKEDMNAL